MTRFFHAAFTQVQKSKKQRKLERKIYTANRTIERVRHFSNISVKSNGTCDSKIDKFCISIRSQKDISCIYMRNAWNEIKEGAKNVHKFMQTANVSNTTQLEHTHWRHRHTGTNICSHYNPIQFGWNTRPINMWSIPFNQIQTFVYNTHIRHMIQRYFFIFFFEIGNKNLKGKTKIVHFVDSCGCVLSNFEWALPACDKIPKQSKRTEGIIR